MSTTVFPSNNSLIPGLDGLRALAVIAVLMYHLELPFMFKGGFLGVDIFFTVSGFLITALLIKEFSYSGNISISQFYLRRFKRLMPVVYVVLAITFLICAWYLPESYIKTRNDSLAALVYLSNWWQIFLEQSYFESIGRPPMLHHLWSLAIEQQFYLIWPVLVFLCLKFFGLIYFGLLSIALALASTIWISYLSIESGAPIDADPSRLYFGTDTHSIGLLIGAILATFFAPWSVQPKIADILLKRQSLINLIGILSFVCLLIVMQYRAEMWPFLFRGGLTIFSLITGILIISVIHSSGIINQFFSAKIFQWIGKRSYGLYICHWPIFMLMRPGFELPSNHFWQALSRLTLTFLVAELSYRLIEEPLRSGGVWKSTSYKKYLYILVSSLLVVGLVYTLISKNHDSREFEYQNKSQNESQGNHKKVVNDFSSQFVMRKATQIHSAECQQDYKQSPKVSQDQQIHIFGDSVMLGIADFMRTNIYGVTVDAKVGRQGKDGLAAVLESREKISTRSNVVIHFGTNGFLAENHLRQMLNQLSGVKNIVLVNVYAPRKWESDNNALLATLASQYDNVSLLDWKSIVESNPEFLNDDQIHPNYAGIKALAFQIKKLTGGLYVYQVDRQGLLMPNSCF